MDEGPAAKLARFTNDLIAENHQRKAINTNQSKRKLLYESTDGNASDDDVIILLLKSHLIGAENAFFRSFRMIAIYQAILIIQ